MREAEEIAVDALVRAANNLDWGSREERIAALRSLGKYVHNPRAADALRRAAGSLDYRSKEERLIALEVLGQTRV